MRMLRSTIALAFIVLFAGACASTPTEREIPADGSASAFVLNSGDEKNEDRADDARPRPATSALRGTSGAPN